MLQDTETMNKKLSGIVPPLVTPLLPDGGVDLAGSERLTSHVLSGGVHGLFLLGTTGEGPSLPFAAKERFVRHVCSWVADRIPVLVGITDPAEADALALAEAAASAGATAVVVAPPFYFSINQDELWHYIKRLAERLPLPFYFYNMPFLTKVPAGLDLAKRCLDLDACLGIKDSSGDLAYYKKLCSLVSDTPEKSLFIGPEELLVDSLLAGGSGGVSGGANVWPELYVELFRRANRGDWSGAQAMQADIGRISEAIYAVGGYGASIIKSLKFALELMGICRRDVASPLERLSERESTALELAMARVGATVGRT